MYDEEDEILVVEQVERDMPDSSTKHTVSDTKGPPTNSELLNNDALADANDTPPSPPTSHPASPALMSTDSESTATSVSTPTRRRKAKNKSRAGSSRPASSPLLGRASSKLAGSPLLSRANRIGIGKKDKKGGDNVDGGGGAGGAVGGSHGSSASSSPRKSPKKRSSMPEALIDPDEEPDSGDENLMTFTAEIHGQGGDQTAPPPSGDHRRRSTPSPCDMIMRQGVDNPAFVASDSGYALNSKVHMEMTNDETSF